MARRGTGKLSPSAKAAASERRKRVEEIADQIEDREAAAALVRARRLDGRSESRALAGDEFIFDSAEGPTALVGHAGAPIIAEGEATLFVGGDGVGKSTLAQQVAIARIGLRHNWLGYPVEEAKGTLLYLAMDRPRQVQRSLSRMVGEPDRAILANRLAVWCGPLPIDPLSSSHALADWIEDEFDDVSDVVIDSYKDLAPGLSDDLVGTQVNLAMQEVLARGMLWLGIHHQRKLAQDATKQPTLHDVYGSRWLTAGVGSVFLVLGDAGDTTVTLQHAKSPMLPVGPILVRHDHARGSSSRVILHKNARDVLIAESPRRMSLSELAEAVFGDSDRRFQKRVERELEAAGVEAGVHKFTATRGGSGGTSPTRYRWEDGS